LVFDGPHVAKPALELARQFHVPRHTRHSQCGLNAKQGIPHAAALPALRQCHAGAELRNNGVYEFGLAHGPTFEPVFDVMFGILATSVTEHKEGIAIRAGTAVHLGEFVAMALMIAGLLVLYFALDVSAGAAHWMGFFGAVSAGIALALYAVLQAVDGVANKQADLAWLSAPAAEQAARFASAEAIRWVEWGLKSYQGYTLGLALLLFGIAIAATARVPRPIGYLMGLSGLAFIVSGWVIGVQGFADIGAAPSDLAQFFLPVSMIWLLVVAWRRTSSLQPAAA
jgi:hypothetical protein